jgi:hypothetical protein
MNKSSIFGLLSGFITYILLSAVLNYFNIGVNPLIIVAIIITLIVVVGVWKKLKTS